MRSDTSGAIGAKAAALNVTAVAPSGSGHLTIFPSGESVPLASSINFYRLAAGAGAFASATDVALSTQALDVSVYPVVMSNGTVHLVLDVAGYFM